MGASGLNWMCLERRWNSVMSSETTLSSRSGRWKVQLEYSGEGAAPIAGEPDEVAIYRGTREIARWELAEIDLESGDSSEGGR